MVAKFSLSEANAMAEARREAKKDNIAAAKAIYQRIVAGNPENRKAKKELLALQNKSLSNGAKKQRESDLKRLTGLYHKGNVRATKAEAHRLITLYPKQPLPHHILGAIHSEAGENEEAAKCLHRAVLIDPSYTAAINNLGAVLRNLNRLPEALACFQQALRLDPDNPALYRNLGNVLVRLGRLHEGFESYRRAIKMEPQRVENYLQLGQAHAGAGHTDEARLIYEQALTIDPSDPAVRHQLNALNGNTTSSTPSAYITKIFDEAASTFDKHMVDRLQYSAPEKLRGLLNQLTGDNPRDFGRTLDLGCGTGLSGVAFSDVGGHITGIDLSAKMLALAKNRDIYKDVVQGDLVTATTSMPHKFDLFICADVLVYVGDPNPLFESVAGRATSGALFLFTTEHADGENFQLLPTARFAHSRQCIESAAMRCAMTLEHFEIETLRLERGEKIMGGLYAFRCQ